MRLGLAKVTRATLGTLPITCSCSCVQENYARRIYLKFKYADYWRWNDARCFPIVL